MHIHSFSDIQQQVWATFVVNILVFGCGCGVGWYSPTLPLLKSLDRNPLADGRPIDQNEAGWIGACFSCGGIGGAIGFGLLANVIGIKNTLLLGAAPLILSWIAVFYAQYVWHLYVARILCGMASAAAYVCVPLFNGEIASDHVRGQLNAYMQISVYGGMTLGFVMGSYLAYHTVPLVFLIFPLIYLLLLFWLPDSPQQLLKQNRIESAEQSLRFYRNCKDTTHEKELIFRTEFDKLKAIANQNNESPKITCSDFWAIRKTILIGSVLICMSHFCGTFVMITYAVTIFENSGSSIDASVSSIIMGSVMVVGVYTASMCIERFGRKKLMIVSSAGAAFGLIGTGIFSLLVYKGVDMEAYNMVPIISLSFYIFIAAIGLLPVPYVYAVEIFPQKLRRIGCTICSSTLPILAIIMVKLFPIMLEQFGVHVCMFVFATNAVLGTIFELFAMHETKGINIDVLEPINVKGPTDRDNNILL